MDKEILISECETVDDFEDCVRLQREVFDLPEMELSPVRHLVVTKNAGGFVLGAYCEGKLVGFSLSVPAFLRGEKAYYSHMTAVKSEFQSVGLGAKLKWTQREWALDRDVRYVKWTFEPWKARNAYFNLEKLGATMAEYNLNFYGIDYATRNGLGLASDRLFAEWDLKSEKVLKLANGETPSETAQADLEISVTPDWSSLLANDPDAALAEQARLRSEFTKAFADGYVVRGFRRDDAEPKYLLYKE